VQAFPEALFTYGNRKENELKPNKNPDFIGPFFIFRQIDNAPCDEGVPLEQTGSSAFVKTTADRSLN